MEFKLKTNTRAVTIFTTSNLLTFTFFAACFFLLHYHPLLAAGICTLAIAAHETAHMLALKSYSVPAYGMVTPVYSWHAPLEGAGYKYRHLSNTKKAKVLLAGPVANIILAVLLVITLLLTGSNSLVPIAMGANGVVAFLAVLPFFGDGKELIALLYGPHKEDLDSLYAFFWILIPLAPPFFLFPSLSLLALSLWVGIAALFSLTTWISGGNTKGGVHTSPMSKTAKGLCLLAYLLVMSTSLLFVTTSLTLY
jgi:hypothetical protein